MENPPWVDDDFSRAAPANYACAPLVSGAERLRFGSKAPRNCREEVKGWLDIDWMDYIINHPWRWLLMSIDNADLWWSYIH